MDPLQQKKFKQMLADYGVTVEITPEEWADPVIRKRKLKKLDLQVRRGKPDDYLKELGESIRQKRKSQNLDLKTYSELSKVAYANLSQLENGRSNISVLTLKKLAEALGCDLRIEFVRRYQQKTGIRE